MDLIKITRNSFRIVQSREIFSNNTKRGGDVRFDGMDSSLSFSLSLERERERQRARRRRESKEYENYRETGLKDSLEVATSADSIIGIGTSHEPPAFCLPACPVVSRPCAIRVTTAQIYRSTEYRVAEGIRPVLITAY